VRTFPLKRVEDLLDGVATTGIRHSYIGWDQ
jgi:hypothetical protein